MRPRVTEDLLGSIELHKNFKMYILCTSARYKSLLDTKMRSAQVDHLEITAILAISAIVALKLGYTHELL